MATTTATRYTITVASELQVVGYNPEMADMDNPRGEIVKTIFFLLAEDVDGNRLRYGCYRSEVQADVALQHLAPAVSADAWDETYPCYGSRAYEAYGEADAIAAEARMVEDEAWGFDTRYSRYF